MDLGQFRYDIIGFSSNVLGIRLHPGQERFLRETIVFREDGTLVYKYINLSAANRWGKTVCLAVIHLFFAFYKHGLRVEGPDWATHPYGIINLCPLVDLANILRDMIDAILRSESKEQINNPEGRGYCLIAPLFEKNEKGSFLVTFGDYKGFRTRLTHVTLEYRTTDDNAKAVQGSPKFLVTFDEAGRQRAFVNLMGSHVVPRTLDTGGIIVTATTPDVDTQTDYEEWWRTGDPTNFFRDMLHMSMMGSILENPYVTKKLIDELKSGTPEYLWGQVLGGEFVQHSEAFFSKLALDKQFRTDVQPDRQRRAGHFYIIGGDLAVAKAGDRSVFTVWDATTRPCRAVWRVQPKKGTPHPELIAIMKELLEYYNGEWASGEGAEGTIVEKCDALLVYDSTGLGGKMFRTELQTLTPRPRGYDFGGGGTNKKLNILSSLRIFLDKSWVEFPAEWGDWKQELKDYTRQDAKLETDAVMANALAAYMAERSITAEEAEERIGVSIY